MEAEVSGIVGAEKNAHNPSRSDYRCGYRPRRLDTRMGTMYLMVPKLRNRGYIPFFVTERKRSKSIRAVFDSQVLGLDVIAPRVVRLDVFSEIFEVDRVGRMQIFREKFCRFSAIIY